MTTVYQIRGFAFYDPKNKHFKPFKLYDGLISTKDKIDRSKINEFMDLVDSEQEAYTFYQLTP